LTNDQSSQNTDFKPDAQKKMHTGEFDLDDALVQRLLTGHFPDLVDLPIALVHSTGTVNAIFRIGDSLCARLPRLEEGAESLKREWTWLPRIAPFVPLKIPKPVALGKPTVEYPYPSAVYDWVEGVPYEANLVGDERQAALDLTHFILELRKVDIKGAPRGGRLPLNELDQVTRESIEACRGEIDTVGAAEAWAQALTAPVWDGVPVWIHADLLKSNLLVQDGRLCAVIDFGSVGIGDPAMDVVPAWSVFSKDGRKTFRHAMDVDDATWRRARGYALHQAVRIIPYYSQSNPEFVAMAKHTILEVLADIKGVY
jgi:aminoglycoside phosphotransferase (APT) family kinase protein